ncbi:MAG: hypothetical protein QW041_01345 [Candidatus Pacearchaeota archaeon]
MGVLKELKETEERMKREEQYEKLKPYLKFFLWLFLIVVIGGAIYLFYMYVPSSYKIVSIIVILTFLFFFFSAPKEKRISTLILMIIITILIIIFMPQIEFYTFEGYSKLSNVYRTIGSHGIGEGLSCIINAEKCFGEEAWETKTMQQLGGSMIEVDWSNAINKQPLNVIVPIKIRTNESLELIPTCFLGDTRIETFIPTGDRLRFISSNYIQESSVRCFSENNFSNKLALKFETSIIKKKYYFEIWTGEGASKGTINKIESGPYSLIIKSADPQPFREGRYPITLELRKTSDFNIAKIELFKVETISNNIQIECDFDFEMNADKEKLKQWLKDKDNYLFTCYLDVGSTTDLKKDFISIDLRYVFDAEYKTILKTLSA